MLRYNADTLFSIFDPKDEARLDQKALIVPESWQLTYRQLLGAIENFATQLSQLLPEEAQQAGRAISMAYPNSPEFVIAFLATGFMRLVSSPLNPAYTEDEFAFYLSDAQSSAILVPPGSIASNTPAVRAARKQGTKVIEITWTGETMALQGDQESRSNTSLPTVTQQRQPQPEDAALLLHTSGTTGRPKGVPLTHRNLVTSMRNIVATYDLTGADRTMLVMPLFHVHGLVCGLLASLLSGGCVVVPPKFSASQFWKDFTTAGCNWYTAVPTIHQILLRNPPSSIPPIRFIRSCSSSLAPATFHALEKVFKAPVLEAYAMTEAAHQMTSNPLPSRGVHKPGSVGIGHGVEVVILDDEGQPTTEGEVCIRGANVTPGYLNNAEATAKSFTRDGYFRTGDQGKKDEDGYLVLTGRIKELINRGGEKISPLELDAVLLSHPNVAEAVCFAVPDAMYGQEVQAAVVLKQAPPNGKAGLAERELQAHCVAKLAKFKVPKRVYITTSMPKTATGKIQRRIVSETFFKPSSPAQAKL